GVGGAGRLDELLLGRPLENVSERLIVATHVRQAYGDLPRQRLSRLGRLLRSVSRSPVTAGQPSSCQRSARARPGLPNRAAGDAPEHDRQADIRLPAQRFQEPADERPVRTDVGALAWRDDYLPRATACAAKQAALDGPAKRTSVYVNLPRQGVDFGHDVS